MKIYIYQDEKSHKFWAVEQQGNELHISWGKVGTNGQSQVKSFADAAAAEKAELKLIAEKVKKGYEQSNGETNEVAVSSCENVLTNQSEHTPVTPRVAIPPWISDSDPIIVDTDRFFSNRNFPSNSVHTFAKDVSLWSLLWESKHEEHYLLAQLQRFDASHCHPKWQQGLQEAILRIQQKNSAGSIYSDALLLLVKILMGDESNTTDVMDYLVQHRGVEYITEVVLLLQQIQMSDDKNEDPEKSEALKTCLDHVRWKLLSTNSIIDSTPQITLTNTISDLRFKYGFSVVDLRLRNHLSVADNESWLRCVEKLITALPNMAPRKRSLIGFLLPEKPEIANQIAREICLENYPEAEWLTVVTTDLPTELLPENHCELNLFSEWWMASICAATLLREQGLKALPRLKYYHSKHGYFSHINHPMAIALLIEQESIEDVEYSANLHPESAIYALTATLVKKNNSRWLRLLERIILGNAPALHSTFTWLNGDQQHILFSYFPQLNTGEEIASSDELPYVLTTPVWLQKKKKITGINITLPVLPLASLESVPATKDLAIPLCTYPSTKETLKLLHFYCAELDWGISQAAIDFFEQDNYEALLKIWDKPRWASHIRVNMSVLLQLPENKALKIWNALTHLHLLNAYEVVEYYGLPTLPGLLRHALVVPQEAIPLAAHFGATEVAPLMARAFRQLKSVRDVAERWLLTYPEHAITGLLPSVLGKAGSEREDAATAIRYLAHHGHQSLMEQIAHRYNQSEVLTGLLNVLNSNPLDNFPQKIAKLPAWCTPEVWHRPLLRCNAKALSDSAILHLCTMLSFPREATLYPGITQVIEACTPQSLANFAWDLFLSWESASGSAKDNWAFTALGILGNDDTARKLTPLIRAWPGESQHKRATVGLDVLAAIGSDIALMQLNGIAQKLKFKALQDQARTKIAQIAESRELTVAELEDRLAPDLGLDENGSLLLDFGPRQFTVSFDESLKPFVRDASGSRLKDLPKPNKSDDEALATEAVNRYNLLKKDARMVAAQQISRLESAMCQRRRWTAEQFRLFLVEHPLVRHITQRLMWGVYGTDNQLISCFRVAEDGSFSDGRDNPLTLAQGNIGIPHVLEIPAQQSAEFAQLFSDYELLPPFRQLDRRLAQLSETEKSSDDLQRWADRQTPSGRVAGLMNKGWQRGDVLDAGGYYSFYKPVDDGYIELSVTPGFCVGLPVTEISDSQTVEHIQLCKLTPRKSVYPFSVLDGITASELINDIESLFD
ncbi:DUF4132 domain-containing protein [Escherichia albertii]|uniref:DUF4132 domain-containing protein n=2 Tax=Escherichia albertii TaxID=208962 RepID=UPI0006A10BFC|nr:WGR and DUF4132 domain-containing protein [Escherichia albertii]CTW00896.1 molybdate metabolism regulator [Escherichia coli]EFF0798877.1 WGR and DUF4132 domain-containing protein [Escherichia albertii]EHG7528667.1 WGR and DUF4132 domain-containing protein [Escherichia albertii]MCV3266110.1 WGR and DUF4132 domain-containing protein [Escherichia albertii]MCZ8690858.1 WGR and DUF4132 domain-containing protein [Escherichia albertii]